MRCNYFIALGLRRNIWHIILLQNLWQWDHVNASRILDFLIPERKFPTDRRRLIGYIA